MQTSSAEVGTPLLQLAASNQLPLFSLFFHSSVQPLACADDGTRTARPMIATIAARIMRSRRPARRQLVSPSMSTLRNRRSFRRRSPRPPVLALRRLGGTARSEEHTSEL